MTTNKTTGNSYTLIFIALAFIFATGCGKTNNDPGEPNPANNSNKKQLILMIGDGMGLSQITAASVASGGQLNISRCRHIGLQKVYASDKLVPSSGSTTTAMACGVKTKYLHIGVDHNENPVPNIPEIIHPEGFAAGVVTTSFITDASTACFFAHNPDRYAQEVMALELHSSSLDVIIGGGRRHFNTREDSLNLLDSLMAYGYQVFDNLADAQQLNDGTLACFTNEYTPPKISEGRGDMLSKSAMLAIRLLEKNENGFFLMVEGAQIDWACHESDAGYMLEEMLDFDEAVGAVLDYAENDGNTLVVILGDHETGGFAITDGDEASGDVAGQFITSNHTAVMIPVFAYGPGAEQFTGVYENTELFHKFLNYLEVESRNN